MADMLVRSEIELSVPMWKRKEVQEVLWQIREMEALKWVRVR